MADRYRPPDKFAEGMREVEKQTGFVALIDVLGFRELIGRDEDLSQVGKYINTVVSLFATGKTRGPQFVLFSDNLIIYTADDTANSFTDLVTACSHLAFELADNRIPVRGAISRGSFMRSPMPTQGVILAGRPIVEADFYQHAQDWVGIMLAPSVVRQDDNLSKNTILVRPEVGDTGERWYKRTALSVHLQRWPEIPFHSNSPFDGFVVVPIRRGAFLPADMLQSLRETNEQLEKMRAAAPDPNSQRKYSESLRFLRAQEQRWRGEAQSPSFHSLATQK